MDRFADGVGELHHAIEELRALPVALRAVVGLDLQQGDGVALPGRKLLPPGVQGVDDEIAGLGGTTEAQMQLAGSLVDDTKFRVLPREVGRVWSERRTEE